MTNWGPLYTARIHFTLRVRRSDLDLLSVMRLSDMSVDGKKRAIADFMIAIMDESNPRAICGASWRRIRYALRRSE
jgi:hypothetical protein